MHKYRSAAKKAAWYDYEDDPPTYNPFKKYRPRRSDIAHDAEDGRNEISRTQSDNIRPQSAPDGNTMPSTSTSRRPLSLSLPGPEDRTEDKNDCYIMPVTTSPVPERRTSEEMEYPMAVPEDAAEEWKTQNPWRLREIRIENKPSIDRKGKPRPEITVASQLRATMLNSWLNVMFMFVPAGFALYYTRVNPIVVFTINFLAIFPSGMMLAYALEEVILRLGDTLSGLLSMTISNAVQLISSVLLLKARQIRVLQSFLLGSILANLLLVMGLAFFVGGIGYVEQKYNAEVAQTICMLLLLAVLAIVIPTSSHLLANASHSGVLAQSRGTAVIIMISYFLYLIFQLKTHREMFTTPVPQASVIRNRKRGEASRGIADSGRALAAFAVSPTNIQDEQEDEPQLSAFVACFTLVLSTVLVAFNTEYAINSIQGLLHHVGLSETFLGFVIIPLLSLETASIGAAQKDKMHLTVALTMERCMQTALLVVPLTVLLGWCMSVDQMTLEFSGFSIAALFASIIIVAHVVQEGKSNWLTGALLIKVYLIISLSSYFIHV